MGCYIWGGSVASTPYITHSFTGKYVFQHPHDTMLDFNEKSLNARRGKIYIGI
jgi:hypothetical protein